MGFEFSLSWDFVFRFLSIAVIDLALSGDNALVIGMAAASLCRSSRMWAIVAGGGLAILLRIALTTIATILMQIPLLSAIGGLVLFWVAWKLLRLNVCKADEENKAKQADTFRQAIILIVTADFIMSLDNVLAVAGTARGDVTLLIAGLLLSMPLLMTTGGLVSLLVDRFRWVVFLGSAVIMFAGTRMVFEDRFIEERLHLPAAIVLGVAVLVSLSVTLLFRWINKRRAEQRGASAVG
ncbi:MAG: YjbE family putative metal transport protein [Dehalococcoidia bacterium]|nr:YjbE family putative metal transport protein [Dehalococcoidia bacterium]